MEKESGTQFVACTVGISNNFAEILNSNPVWNRKTDPPAYPEVFQHQKRIDVEPVPNHGFARIQQTPYCGV